MAVPVRGKDAALSRDPALGELLCNEPYRFGFFQAVRLLERLYPERQPVGFDAPPMREATRFHAHLSMSFPASEIYDLAIDPTGRRPADMVVTFIGLTGPMAALPRYYTETLLERVRQKDYTLRDFLDLFNHRLISLFFRAWDKYHFWTGFERAELLGRRRRDVDPRQYRSFVLESRPQHDRVSQVLLDLGGVGTPSLRYKTTRLDQLEARTAIADETLRFYSGLLAQQHRSAIGLQGLLSDYFNLVVQVIQFCGQWLYLERENQTCLTEGGNTQLGVSAVVGERFWDRQGKFRIRLGPLTYRQFLDFLPLGTAFRPLAHLARLYAGREFDMDVQVVLLAAEVPWCQLSDSAETGARLGWNTWIRNREMPHDATDAVFNVVD